MVVVVVVVVVVAVVVVVVVVVMLVVHDSPDFTFCQIATIETVDEASRRAAIAALKESPWVQASKTILTAPDLSTRMRGPGVSAGAGAAEGSSATAAAAPLLAGACLDQ